MDQSFVTPQSLPGEPQQLSKKAIKKAAKAERIAAAKLERRAKEKEKKKEKRRTFAEKRIAGELHEDEEKKRLAKRRRVHWGGKVVVDLGFDEMMSEKEVKSLSSQLAYTYSANRNASFPFSLIYTSLNGRTLARLESMNDASYKRWTDTQWWTESYLQLWSTSTGESTCNELCQAEAITSLDSKVCSDQETVRHNVVYLTADSDEELVELKPEEVYIIGGICDHNRYKNLCLNKAKETGVRSARLPIGRYLASMSTRKVLTVNQVFEILVKWVETRNWKEALYAVVPRRKFQGGGGNDSELLSPDADQDDRETAHE